MPIETTCCVTGHRDFPPEQLGFVREALHAELLAAVRDGYRRFLSGFADGSDLLFAELVLELRAGGYPVTLEAALPYPGRLRCGDQRFQTLLRGCSAVRVASETAHRGCYLLRNRVMVQASARVLAVYDGRPGGGTAYTVRYARELRRELRIVPVTPRHPAPG